MMSFLLYASLALLAFIWLSQTPREGSISSWIVVVYGSIRDEFGHLFDSDPAVLVFTSGKRELQRVSLETGAREQFRAALFVDSTLATQSLSLQAHVETATQTIRLPDTVVVRKSRGEEVTTARLNLTFERAFVEHQEQIA